MLQQAEFEEQCQRDLLPVLRRWDLCEYVRWNSQLKCIELSCKTREQSRQTRFEVRILYNRIYNVPQLQFRYWELAQDTNDIERWKLLFLDPSEIPTLADTHFSITIDHTAQLETWYFLNPCDTNANVGPPQQGYLTRWLSFYGTILDKYISLVFIES